MSKTIIDIKKDPRTKVLFTKYQELKEEVDAAAKRLDMAEDALTKHLRSTAAICGDVHFLIDGQEMIIVHRSPRGSKRTAPAGEVVWFLSKPLGRGKK